jgi:hypothetical protein
MEATLDVHRRLIPEKTVDHKIPMHIDFAFSQWAPSQDLMSIGLNNSNGLASQIQMESADPKHWQLALQSNDHTNYDDHFQPRIDRESAVVGSSEDFNAKTDQSAWADLKLTDKLFGEFDKLLDEFEIVLVKKSLN